MTLPLTPAILEAAYEFLRATPPFVRWRLPHADEVELRVCRTRQWMGLFDSGSDDRSRISVSSARIGHTDTLLRSVAHEMIHLYQFERGTATASEHNAEFFRLAAQIARHHGFDPKEL